MEHILKKYEEFCTKTDTGHWNMALLIGFDKGFNLCSQRYNKDGWIRNLGAKSVKSKFGNVDHDHCLMVKILQLFGPWPLYT